MNLCACGCGQPRDVPGQRYRRECQTAYMRGWRARRNAELAELLLELSRCAIRSGEGELAERAIGAAQRLIPARARSRGRP